MKERVGRFVGELLVAALCYLALRGVALIFPISPGKSIVLTLAGSVIVKSWLASAA